MLNFIIGLSRNIKRAILLIFDALMLLAGLWAAISLRYGKVYIPYDNVVWLFAVTPLLGWVVFIRLGLYRAVIRYLNFQALYTVVVAVSLFVLLWSTMLVLLGLGADKIPRSVLIIYWLICLLTIGGSRFVARWIFSASGHNPNAKNVLIYGAGTTGRQLALSLDHSQDFNHIAYIDDDKSLQGRYIQGKHVYAFKNIKSLIYKCKVDAILLATPSLSRAQRQNLINRLEPFEVKVQTIPAIDKIASGELKISDIQDVDLYDLLGRTLVEPVEYLLHKNIVCKNVLVTGAGGSIGGEICRQVLKQNPNSMFLLEFNEFALYTIERELQKINNLNVPIIPILANILNTESVAEVFAKNQISTVYHAAAYKHVPMVESNSLIGLKNNVIGTYNVALTAQKNQVETFVLISTDKAVRPTNVMGASKRFAELILQAMAEDGKIVFSIVRFGNVLDSSGSVISLFREQIEKGGPVTVTHPAITRFFMLIPEAVELVIQAGAMAKGGEVFVLDMGESVKIDYLARHMILLSGLTIKDETNEEGDIEIKYTGLREGEKLYEELIIGDDNKPTEHPKIMCAQENRLSLDEIIGFIEKIETLENSKKAVKKLLKQVVPEYNPEHYE